MNASWLDSGIRHIACTSIAGYQKHISPRKGFSCAHRLLYGGESCSQYVKRTIAQKGLVGAIETSQRRFQACKEANRILRARMENSESEDERKPPKHNRNSRQNQDNYPVDFGLGCCEWGAEGAACAITDIGGESSQCCASGADFGSGADCGAAACGSCTF